MKKETIRGILTYKFTPFEESALMECEIANWCWWKWWVDFDEIIARNISYIPKYDPNKKKKFFQDLKRICIEHDVDFRLKLWFVKSNYRFAKKIFLLMKSWTTLKERFVIALICFFLLCRFWKKFYYLKK